MLRLIANADDLGCALGIDHAVAALRQAGALSSATAMACGASLPARFPSPTPSFGVGCHLVLVDGAPAARPETVPSLLVNGRFRPTLGQFTADLLRGRIRDDELEREAVAQVRLLQARGCKLTHIDTHKHTHMHPRVLRPLLRAALQCGIGAVRNPFEPEWARNATLGAPLLRRFQLRLLNRLRETFLREVDQAGMRTTDGALGVLATGTLDARALERLLEALAEHGKPDECYELVCHPGFHDAALDALPTRLRAERERERAALLAVLPLWTASGRLRLQTFADL